MRVVSGEGRLAVVVDGRVVDVERVSRGRFDADPQAVYTRWEEFVAWAAEEPGLQPHEASGPALDETELAAPVPEPRQIFAIGLNYQDHAAEGGLDAPEATPMVFTKFPTSVAGPYDEIPLPAGAVDYEAELVAVIGKRAERVSADHAWCHVAGLTIGQDLSERELQTGPPHPPQFSLAKSFPKFSPIGPAVVTLDEFEDPSDLEIGCRLNGEQLQKARTREMIFSVPRIIAYLSSVLPLLPGDLIFTGTPAGVGFTRTPKRLIAPGDELLTYVEGIGSMKHRFYAGPGR
ncbi:fumarylacetoacetate hydrolase family protein [Streptomyces sp. NPDC004629]|uniref:fumarylacetoacetate hydrolase family protein n=1 Tax=Streptomyces sp. NPDC004629 TaxID=3364705 RepID=UPI003692F2D9